LVIFETVSWFMPRPAWTIFVLSPLLEWQLCTITPSLSLFELGSHALLPRWALNMYPPDLLLPGI
jgi:hypothetical protein